MRHKPNLETYLHLFLDMDPGLQGTVPVEPSPPPTLFHYDAMQLYLHLLSRCKHFGCSFFYTFVPDSLPKHLTRILGYNRSSQARELSFCVLWAKSALDEYLTMLPQTKKLIAAAFLTSVFVALLGCQAAQPPTPTTAPTITTEPARVAVTAPATALATSVATVSAAKSTFVLADVSDKPTAAIDVLQPIADYLGTRLGKYGISSVTIKIAPDFQTLQQWLKAGDVDLIFQTPYPAVLLADSINAPIILRRWKDGDSDYYTVVFGRADSGMKTLTDLKGRMLAVQDDFSTSAYMLPLAYILEAGLKIARKDSTSVAVASDEVGFTYSKSDDNTLQWVISGKVAAGATDFRHYEKIPEDTRKQLVVLVETEKIPRGVVMLSPVTNPSLADGIKSILLDMTKSDEGNTTLQKFQNTARFDELPSGPDAALARVRALSKLLNSGK